MECVGCQGRGCDDCGQMGEVLIETCPLEALDEEIAELIDLALLFKKGLPPVAGGTLDQTRWFLSFAAFVYHEIDYWKNKLMIIEE